MYSPPYNKVENHGEIVAFMRANNFALLVTGTGGSLHGSHLPVLVHERDDEVMVVFFGPHAYVSPRWYEEEERVPTWNYAALHAYGVPKVLDDPKAKHANQRRLVETMDPQWLPSFDALRPDYVKMMLEGIVNFEIAVTRIETRWKLSQNRGRREQELIAAELEKSADSAERALAALTRKQLAD